MEKVLDEASQKAGSAAKEVLELSRGELRVLAAEWGWGRGSWAYLEVEHTDSEMDARSGVCSLPLKVWTQVPRMT